MDIISKHRKDESILASHHFCRETIPALSKEYDALAHAFEEGIK